MNQDSNTGVYFQCQLCGECCSSWNIPVEAEKADRLLEKPWAQERLRTTRRTLQRQSADMYRIPLTDENVCVFLGEDRRCLIEVNEGLSLKPHECQRFPFATVKAADGIMIHDTSAACKSISEKLLLAFQPILPKPTGDSATEATEKMAADSDIPQTVPDWLADVETLPERLWLTGLRKTDWQTLQTLRARWKPWFEDERLSAEQALTLVNAELQHNSAFKKRIHPTTQENSKPVGWKRQKWRQHILVLYFLRKPYQSLSAVQLITNGTYYDPRLFGEPLTLRTQDKVVWSADQERYLKAFLYNILCRNRLLSVGGSVEALVAMAGIAAGLVRWYAKALATLQNESKTKTRDVATAIRLVERYYAGHQPNFFHFFKSRLKAWLILRCLGI